MKKPVSKYFLLFLNNFSLYKGFYMIKIEEMRKIFKQINGRPLDKKLKEGEALYDKINDAKDPQEKVKVELFKKNIDT